MPEVSVIIPIYNTAAYLRKALDNICGQTLKELEIILIDDGSTDGSHGIIEEYAKRDARIRWYAQPNYNPQIQISAESETKRSIFREKDKTKRSKKESAQHSKSRNKSFVMTSVSAL